MRNSDAPGECVQIELNTAVLRRLLLERNLVASDLRLLNSHSCRAVRHVLLSVLTASRLHKPGADIQRCETGPQPLTTD